MRRKYTKRIEVKGYANTPDGVGGQDTTIATLGNSWCNIKTVNRDKLVSYGLDIPVKAILIELRYRADLDYEQQGLYFTYKGVDYYPKNITVEGLEEEEVTIFAISE